MTYQPCRCVCEAGVWEGMMVATRPNLSSVLVGKFTSRQRSIRIGRRGLILLQTIPRQGGRRGLALIGVCGCAMHYRLACMQCR